ncbi:uncharacterized protein LOC127881247 isoform X2 [Dreissena polymorpha]|nr:uncharacterized protein LOC127881247 isoform X2 [Dreissena polymorpha]
MCIPGSQCDVDLCANGATCVNTRRGDQCFCSGGFTGKLCNETAGSIMGHLKFIEVPQSRMVKKGGQSVSLCRVESPASEEKVVYTWYFKEKTIEDYKDRTKLRDGEGLLLINDFNVEFEGRYTCVARAGNVTAEHTITLSMDECFLGINGPKDTVDYTGRTVILSCSIEEAGDIWWEKDNVTIDIGGQFHIWQSKTINNLRIAIAEEQDSGVYTCVARDITGCKNRRSATLTIQNWGKHETYCGKSYPDQINEDRASPLIAMGLNANPKENPWHVSLFSMDIMHPFCGGSLISQSFVVTAAHCITDRWTEEQFKASVLIEFASLSCTLDGNEIRRVKFIYIHPQYNKTAPFDSDIALLELSEPVEYSLNIRPICVQSYSKTEKYMIGASYTQGKAVGCGGVQHLGRQSLKLQQIMLPYVQRADCKDDLETTGIYKFTKNMICAGYKQWRVGDVCRGDSGGGFMMELPGGFKWVLAGIVSFGFRCNDPDHYSYFTHVGMFYDWIESIAKFNDEKVKLDFLVTTRSDPESVVMHVTNASTVGRDNNCSGIWSDTDEGFTGYILYTAPKYEDNRHCVLVVSTFTNNHVVQVHFNRFEMEGSDSCKFDSLNIYSGEREDSASLGGPYCASSLNGRTILSSGNTMRLVFKTDQSYSFLGFQANFTFLPMDHLDKDCRCSGHEVCVVRGFEKMCIAGSQCKSVSHCENGATCVNNGSVDHCYCTAGYTGNFCTEMAGSAGRLKFTHAPQSRTVKKGGESDNLCQVEKPASGPPVVYSWYFKGRIIGDYQRSSKFGDQGQGLLMIGDFNKQLEGRYTCVARAGNATAEHTFTLTMVEECLLEMQGPSDSDYDTDETAIVFCAAYRAKDVWWEKDNVKIKTESTGKFIKMQNNFLRIAYTATNDSGVYTCVAHDTKGCESRRSARLTVLNRGNYEKYCGIAYTDQVRKYIAQGYISMGDAALPKDNPWHVSLISKGQNRPFCGGSLISQKFVVTAAHCIGDYRPVNDFQKNVMIEFGSLKCNAPGDLTRGIKSITIHPQFNKTAQYDSNIALLELSEPVEYSDNVRPACVQDYSKIERLMIGSSSPPQGKAVGCGVLREGSKQQPNDLQQIYMPYVQRYDCEEGLEGTNYRITENTFCAGQKKQRVGDVCAGDSGGGFMMETPGTFQWVLAGIVSFGFLCDSPDHYSYFTNVGKFYGWIDGIAKFTDEKVNIDFVCTF